MKNEDFKTALDKMQEKLGKENSAIIADDLAMLLTDNVSVNTNIENQAKEIEKLKSEKDVLINTNGKLLQQVAMGMEEKKPEPEDEPKKKDFNFRSAFDDKGHFLK